MLLQIYGYVCRLLSLLFLPHIWSIERVCVELFAGLFSMGLRFICYLCLCFWPIGRRKDASSPEASRRLPLMAVHFTCVLLLVPVLLSGLFFFAGFLRVTPSRLAVHSTLLTSVNYNIVFPVVRHLRSCCPYFIMCYLHGEFDSSVCYIFPSLAMGSFKLTMIPRSDTSSCFRVLLSWQSDIGLLSSTNSGWTICRPLPRGWFNTELG